jgi:flagellar hook assembly protein FlgD
VQADPDGEGVPSYLAPVLLAALAIATLVALGAIQTVRLDGVVLDLAQVSRVERADAAPDRVVRVRFRMRSSTDDAVVRIVDRDGNPVATLADGKAIPGDDEFHAFYWDGRTESGAPAPPGRYRSEIVLRDQGREIVPEESVLLQGGDR